MLFRMILYTLLNKNHFEIIRNDQKCFVQVNVFEEILETKDIEVNKELLSDVTAVTEDDPLAIALLNKKRFKIISYLYL
jgi:hypothetical protein